MACVRILDVLLIFSCSSSFVDELFEMFMSLDVGEAGPVRLYMLDADARHFSFVRLL